MYILHAMHPVSCRLHAWQVYFLAALTAIEYYFLFTCMEIRIPRTIITQVNGY